jgi:hypothetical protein
MSSESKKGRTITVHQGNVAVGQFASTGDERRDFEIFERMLREAGFAREETPLPTRIRHQARAFSRVAVDLGVKICVLRGQSLDCVAPFLVNAALAIELFLKAIAEHHGKSLRGHSLVELFDAQPAAGLSDIKRAFEEAPDDLTDFDEASDLRALFVNLDYAFITWRYVYEGRGEGRWYGAKAALLLMAVLDVASEKRNPP